MSCEAGLRRIVFSSANDPLFCLDRESAEHVDRCATWNRPSRPTGKDFLTMAGSGPVVRRRRRHKVQIPWSLVSAATRRPG